jgi:hypothetical protein
LKFSDKPARVKSNEAHDRIVPRNPCVKPEFLKLLPKIERGHYEVRVCRDSLLDA